MNKIKVTEADLREQIRDLCELFGWKMYFTWKSYHSPKGFPDLVLANPEQKRVLFAELKTETGKVTPEQAEWLTTLHRCHGEVYLWRPADIEDIAKILRMNKQDFKELLKQETAGALIKGE